MDNKSIYIICLEKGFNNGEQGTSYIEMIQHLESNGFTIDENFHYYFYVWFFDNFYMNGVTNEREAKRPNMSLVPWQFQPNQYKEDLKEFRIGAIYCTKCIMMFEARQNYLNYLRFKGSDKKSNIALVTAIVTSIISVLLGIVQIYYANRQDNATIYTNAKSVESSYQSNQQYKEVTKQLQDIQKRLPLSKPSAREGQVPASTTK